MKFFASIFLFIIVLAQTFSSFITEADFYLNRDYIAKNLCVNRDKPMMHCNGKCYLAKKLNDEGKSQSPASKTERLDVTPFFVPSSFSLPDFTQLKKSKYFIINEKEVSTFSPFIFHPPTA
jgi:hypothetical protein